MLICAREPTLPLVPVVCFLLVFCLLFACFWLLLLAFCLLLFAFACFCLLLFASACFCLLLLEFACFCLLAFACFCSYFCFAFATAKAETSKAKFESQARRNGESPLQHDGGMCPKWPESNFKAKSKASRHDRYACITGEWGEAANSTLLLLVYTLRTLIS